MDRAKAWLIYLGKVGSKEGRAVWQPLLHARHGLIAADEESHGLAFPERKHSPTGTALNTSVPLSLGPASR